MDLDEVEVLQLHPDPGEQPRHGVGRGHEQALPAVDVVDRGGLGVDEVRQRRQPVLGRPGVAAEQHGRGAVGERRRVAGGHRRALALAEHRRERGQLLQRGVGAQVGVAGDPEVGRDQVVEEPALVCGREPLVRTQGQLVLGLAADAPLLGGDGHVVAHREPGARLDVARRRRDQVTRADRGERLGPVHRRAGGVGPQQRLAQPLAHGDRGVRRGVDSPGDAGLDLTEGDLVGHEDRRLEAGPAGLLHVVGRASVAASDEPSTASRVRLKSRLCLSTAPAATSPIRSPASPNRATRPSRAVVSMSWLEALAYLPLARANGMRLPPRIAARRGPDGPRSRPRRWCGDGSRGASWRRA